MEMKRTAGGQYDASPEKAGAFLTPFRSGRAGSRRQKTKCAGIPSPHNQKDRKCPK